MAGAANLRAFQTGLKPFTARRTHISDLQPNSCARPRRAPKCHRGLVVAEGQSLETSFGTTSSGRAGAVQLREEPPSTRAQPLNERDGQTVSRPPSQTPTAAAAFAPQPEDVLRQTADFLRGELHHIFTTGAVTRERYADNVHFQDPVARLRGRNAYVANIQLLRSVFDIEFTAHQVEPCKPDGVEVRWTMVLTPKFVPWRPRLTLTGRSHYTVAIISGHITSHTDTWDALSDNSYLSLEGLALVVRSLTDLKTTPSLETPKYTVLRKTGDYEVRRYEPYMVAEVAMPAGAGPAAGEGFNDLAGFIFGGNNRNASMEMTTPVFSNAGQSGQQAGRMQFVMEERYGQDPTTLPTPNNARVERRLEERKTVAALVFSGLPLDWEVREAERRLRGALLLDGLQAEDSWYLARYNDPFTLPFLRRNEVLVRLEEGYEP